MVEPLDILDTQVLVYCANDAEQWASDIYDEVLAGERIVYLPRYVTTEFYQVMERTRGAAGANVAWEHLTALWDAPAAVVPHPNRFRVHVDSIRHHATTRTLAAVCDVQPKDAPILAAAYRIAEFVEIYDPPSTLGREFRTPPRSSLSSSFSTTLASTGSRRASSLTMMDSATWIST